MCDCVLLERKNVGHHLKILPSFFLLTIVRLCVLKRREVVFFLSHQMPLISVW